jgi:predicted DNA-binding transcriptional regulator AlpA
MKLTPTVLLRRTEVMRRVGLESTTFDELRKRPDFPRPVMITRRTPGWIESEVENWIEGLKAQREGRAQ